MDRDDVIDAWDRSARSAGWREAIHPTGVDSDAWLASGVATATWLADSFPPAANVLVLDYGCGAGRVTVPLSKRYRYVLGYDPSPAMIHHAHQHNAELGGNAEFCTVLGGDSGCFDLVVCLAVAIHHSWADGEALLGVLAAHTAPGGTVCLDVGIYETEVERRAWNGVTTWTFDRLTSAAAASGLVVAGVALNAGAWAPGRQHASCVVLHRP